ncbi:hypothetical protein DERP_003770 [Dermatophagoides pteronyssinus]|uniref:Uncharacterized protein n=1 Tax=Dermatophagoides pteronyssinus TaxID=6956 RepID=A0ABQ8JMF8_DERPT|nr:hypothetical protein DERP_003770 [Dermatophagoides pteronyssinus]
MFSVAGALNFVVVSFRYNHQRYQYHQASVVDDVVVVVESYEHVTFVVVVVINVDSVQVAVAVVVTLFVVHHQDQYLDTFAASYVVAVPSLLVVVVAVTSFEYAFVCCVVAADMVNDFVVAVMAIHQQRYSDYIVDAVVDVILAAVAVVADVCNNSSSSTASESTPTPTPLLLPPTIVSSTVSTTFPTINDDDDDVDCCFDDISKS